MRASWRPAPRCARRPYIYRVLDALAVIAAGIDVLLAMLLVWGLSEEAQSGGGWKSPFAIAFLVSTAAMLYAVNRTLDDGAGAWLAATALPPLTMLALLVVDRDALWGNFPPPAPMRLLQRVAAVAVFALPGLLAWAAS